MTRTLKSKGPRKDFSGLIEQLLAPYQGWQVKEGEFRSACPFHSGDNKTTFSVFASGRFTCFKCGVSGWMEHLLVKLRRITLKQAQEVLGSSNLPELRRKNEEKDYEGPYRILPEGTLSPYKKHCPQYLVDRRFSPSALKRFEIGYDFANAKIVIPVRDALGSLVGLTYRIDYEGDPSQPSKYWHDLFQKALHLYGFHFWAKQPGKQLFLVEGQLDAVRMWQLGLKAVAIMGSALSDDQAALLVQYAKVDRLVLAFDNDEAGVKATRGAIHTLSRTRYMRGLSCLKYEAKDPGELEDLKNVRVISWNAWEAGKPRVRRDNPRLLRLAESPLAARR